MPVVVKIIAKPYPDAQDLARLQHEYQLLAGLEGPGVVRALALEPWKNNLALVLEEPGADVLAAQLEAHTPMCVDVFLRLAIACARALGAMHPHAIHRDLHPRHMLWNAETGTFKLIDFSLAAAVGPGRATVPPPRGVVGALAFVSPEQTGRMNRAVDFRTDYYSLGVTCYLLLTGQLPFTANDPLEWVHCHISQVPPPPEAVAPHVPPVLGRLVLKLMAKNPDDRYQSAQGLVRDLEECQRQWLETAAIAPFELGRDDVVGQFAMPRRLYGRTAEAQAVRDAFTDASGGRPGLVAVAGPAGIGKSALVHEAARSVLARHGRFATGKFDQFQRHVPYAAVADAVSALVRQLLAEPEERLAHWRRRLSERLGPNGRLAVDLVPELARIIGQPPPVAALNPTEEQNRFLSTIQSLVTAFAGPEHPLVLFLDDLQWSDAPTLTLMRNLLESGDGGALLLVGAYRDDELAEGHPLPAMLGALEGAGKARRLRLEPLDEATLNRLVADTLHSPPERTAPLASVLFSKSAGNPFFVGELLRTLHQDGLLAFDHAEGRWQWDLEGVRRAHISDDIVDFMVARIQRLAPETQRMLREAACIGDTFELGLLARLTGRDRAETIAALLPAVAAGLIAPLGAEALYGAADEDDRARCQFLHDRVRQAAYALVPESERQGIHWRIGRLMLAGTPEPERANRASAIAQQLNEGRAFLEGDDERLELTLLNLAAGRKAKESAAYRSAYGFTRVALELLPADAWARQYDLAFEVTKLHASCAYLSGEVDEAQACYAELLQRTNTPLERAEVHAMRAAQYTFGNRMEQAIEEGIRALGLLGIRLTERPSMAAMVRELALAKLAQGRRAPEDLEEAPLLSDRPIRLAMKILEGFLVPAYLTGNTTLFGTAVLKQATLSMRHGTCDESVSAYSGYAVLLAGLGDLKAAYAFGQLALRLSERLGVVDSKSRTLVLYALFSHSWSQPWSTLDGWFRASVEAGLRSGDFLFMSYAAGYVHLWDPHVDLPTAVAEGRRMIASIRQTTYQNALHAAQCHQQMRLNLRGETDGTLSLSDAQFDEVACVQRMQAANYASGIGIYEVCKLQVAVFHGAWDEAWRLLLAGERSIAALVGSPYMVDHVVFGFLAAARRAGVRGADAGQAWRLVRKFHRRMRAWARHCPANFGLHLHLMDAELAALQGRAAEAPRAFERSLSSARESGFARFEGLAAEAAARYYRAQGLEKVAETYLREARAGYGRWGATAKVRALDAALPSLTADAGGRGAVSFDELSRFNLGLVPELVETGLLDLSTVWKATQAIAGEAGFDRLLVKLMAIVKESAGAQRAVLVLQEGDDEPRFLVAAESAEHGETRLFGREPYEAHPALPVSVLRYALRTRSTVVLHDAAAEGDFTMDPDIQARQPRSVLALPVVNQTQLLGVLYLENNVLASAFTPERLSVLQILAGQAAISIQNVRAAERATYLEAERTIKDTYARLLEARVEERTAELREANRQLMELDRLKTNFLNAVSHELRTPLTSIVGFGEFLKDELGGPMTELQQEFVGHIRKSAKHLQGLVDDLLDFAQLEAGTFKLDAQWGYVRETVSTAFESLRPQAALKGITLEATWPDSEVEGVYDPVRIEQIVLNLVGNAIKFTPDNGKVRLRLAVEDGWARVTVTDTGIGVPPDLHDRLFQKFYQVDPSSTRKAGGTGLGLAISKGLVEAMSGRIGVDSTPGQGSTFWFSFPLQEPAGTGVPGARQERHGA